MVKVIVKLLLSIIGGIIITLITGFFTTPMLFLIGSDTWGFPFYWLSQIIYPGAEKNVNWSNLILDILIWSFIMFLTINLIEFLIIKIRKR
ncbi:MAG: hypothetical protein JSV23_08660 [Promethearchaeota archaeon]|nr:MAG: hypothetical protein JSV23_08660 [Candidatus Lokiarchaeota archaeon]